MKSLVLCLLLIPALGFGQTIYDSLPYNEIDRVSFEKVFDTNGTKDSLFTKAKMWVTQVLKFPQFAIKNEDRENGIIYFSSNTNIDYPRVLIIKKKLDTLSRFGESCNLKFDMKIYVKDSKTKVIVDNMSYKRPYLFSNSETYSELAKFYVNEMRDFVPNNLRGQAEKGTNEYFLRGVLITVKALQSSIEKYMNQKAENDF